MPLVYLLIQLSSTQCTGMYMCNPLSEFSLLQNVTVIRMSCWSEPYHIGSPLVHTTFEFQIDSVNLSSLLQIPLLKAPLSRHTGLSRSAATAHKLSVTKLPHITHAPKNTLTVHLRKSNPTLEQPNLYPLPAS